MRNLLFSHMAFTVSRVCLQGGEQVDLIPGGASIEVTSSNVHEYVRRYTEYRLCKSAEKALEVRAHAQLQSAFDFLSHWGLCAVRFG